MKVLAITNLYPTSYAPTAGTFMEQQIKGLREIGLDVDLMLVERRRRGMRAYWGLGNQVRSRVRSGPPDVVHVMYGGVMADQVTRALPELPVVVSFCGTDLLGEPRVSLTRRLVAGFGVICSHRAARRADAIVVKSKNLLDALPADVRRSKVEIIPNGVDLERFRPIDRMEARKRLNWAPSRRIVLFVTVAGHPRKRVELARAAVARVPCDEGEVEMRIMQGVPHREVSTWLSAADALILTSVHEGGVNVVKEAMACNLPVVSVDVGDVRERLRNVSPSEVVKAGPDELARALRDVLGSGQRSNGRSQLTDLTLPAISNRLKAVYSQAIQSKTAGLSVPAWVNSSPERL